MMIGLLQELEIKERRILKEPNQGTSFMAIRAAKDLLHKSNIDPKEIDMVIVATATPDLPVASTAVFTATENWSNKRVCL